MSNQKYSIRSLGKSSCFLVLIFSLAFVNCQKKEIRLNGFDTDTWKKDRGGCLGLRISMRSALESNKSLLTGLSEEQVETLLGKPDRHQLATRGKKMFVYFLSKGDACKDHEEGAAQKIHIEFNALDQVSILSYAQE